MLNKKNVVALMLILVISFGIQQKTFAITFARMTASEAFPTTADIGNTITGEYVVHDDAKGRIEFVDQSELPAGTIKRANVGDCSNPLILNPGDSCVVHLILPAQDAATQLKGKIIEHISGYKSFLFKPFDIQIIATSVPTPGTATLSLSNEDIHLPQNIRQDIIVTNNSSTVTANNVQVFLPDSIKNKITVTNSCASIPPLGTCKISMTAGLLAPSTNFPEPIYFQGSNTDRKDAQVTILEDSELVASNVTISEPGNANLQLSNTTESPAYIDSVTVGSSLHEVTADSSACASIAGNGTTCNIVLTSTANSYGSDDVTITYHFEVGHPHTVISHVSVNSTTVELYNGNGDLITDGNIRLLFNTADQTFRFKNTGNFNWLNPTVGPLPTLLGVTLTESCSSSTPIAPGSSCTFKFTTNDTAIPGSSVQMNATGTNLTTVVNNVIAVGDLALEPELDPSYLHLGYRAIDIINVTDADATLTEVTPTTDPLLNVAYCPPGDATCAYKTDSNCVATGVVPANSLCRVWFKANDSTTLNAGSGYINITVKANWPPTSEVTNKTENFTGNYSESLYAGGDFTTAGGNTANRIAKCNGTTWSALETNGMDNRVYALIYLNGDLYVGGSFTTAGGVAASRIAKWNGSNWSPLEANGMSGSVTALSKIGSDLYAGGSFTTAGGVTVNNVAKWDGSTWSPLGSGVDGYVRALFVGGNGNLYVGGQFTKHLAKWDGFSWQFIGYAIDTAVWAIAAVFGDIYYMGGTFDIVNGITANHMFRFDENLIPEGSLGSGTSGPVNVLASIGSNLYAGGAFLDASGVPNTAYIAKWIGSEWLPLGVGTDGDVSAFTTMGSNLYVGGDFTFAGGIPDTAYVAKWNSSSSSWSTAGTTNTGMNALVAGLITAPSLVITKP